MTLRIRHLYKKAIIYGTLLAAFFFLAIVLAYTGQRWESIALLFMAFLLAGVAARLSFNRFAMLVLRAKPLERTNGQHLFDIVEGLSMSKGLKAPFLTVKNDPAADVLTGGASRNDAIIIVTSGLLEEFNDMELREILTHEIESADEMGLFIYNVVMAALSTLKNVFKFAIMPPFIDSKGIPDGGAGPIVGKATASDVPAVVRLLIAHNMYNYHYIHDLNRMVMSGSQLFHVARYDGKPVGFIIGEVNNPLLGMKAHITKIITDERYRRMGIGSRLMQEFTGMAERLGCSDCRIDVRVDNRNAISLYEKFEFRKAGILPGHYSDGTGCLIMVKSLEKRG